MWLVFACLDLKILSQKLQGIETPCKWFASMWSFVWLLLSSFPQTLQAYRVIPRLVFLEVFTIIASICSSSFCMSLNDVFFDNGTEKDDISLECSKLSMFNGFGVDSDLERLFSFLQIIGISISGAASPLIWSHSDIARKESKFSWLTFVSP